MDATPLPHTTPVVVDLDGTLIAGDLFWESLFQMLRRRPWLIFMLPVWIAQGKARIKHEICERVELEPDSLLYRKAVIDLLAAEKAAGRPIVLATGSPKKFAVGVARFLGIFDRVLSSSRTVNLTSHRKAQELRALYGDGGFDYIGNSGDDIAIFDIARKAVVVAPDKKAKHWQFSHDAELIETPRRSLNSYLRLLRVHQWLKNALIFVPLLLDHQLGNLAMLKAASIAFVAFSAAASAVYILNDFFDLPLDRRHPSKKNRPLASGLISVPAAMAIMALMLAFATVLASLLTPLFGIVLAGYLLLTTAYSLFLKRMLLIDVFTLAGLYATRIFAGSIVIGVANSFWLLAFSIFFFLSLALAKRFVELYQTGIPEGQRIAGRGYRAEDREIVAMAGLSSGCTAAVVLALYINSPQVFEIYRNAWMLWPLSPIILYITTRIWILAGRGELDDDPVVFIISDWRSQVMIALGCVLIIAASIPWSWA